jgi:hypothetical protein
VKTLLVTAYTPGYADLARRLHRSADEHGARALSVAYDSCGDWARNGHVKPEVVMRYMLEKRREVPVCWVDADAELVAKADALDSLAGDVAVPTLQNGQETLSGTVWFAPTPAAMYVLAAWQDECRKHPEIWDQSALQKVLKGKHPAKVTELRPEFCYIPGTSPPPKKGGVVILHHQASREVRAGTRQM